MPILAHMPILPRFPLIMLNTSLITHSSLTLNPFVTKIWILLILKMCWFNLFTLTPSTGCFGQSSSEKEQKSRRILHWLEWRIWYQIFFCLILGLTTESRVVRRIWYAPVRLFRIFTNSTCSVCESVQFLKIGRATDWPGRLNS